MRKVIIVAPHPDDETLGCGGTLLKHRASGDELFWLIMTRSSAAGGYDRQNVISREKEIETVSGRYGFKGIFRLGFAPAGLDTISRKHLVESVSRVVEKVKPEIIYIPNGNDVHSDHRVAYEALISATKSFNQPCIRKLLCYETLSETEFSLSLPEKEKIFFPNSFSDVSDYLEEKIEIMKIYDGEMKAHPFPRSEENLRALATFRGAAAGKKYAEAFMLLKEIW